MQFSRVVTPVEEIKIWNANSNGFSFVISYESRSGPGLQGNPGFLASWRPVYQNRRAIKVFGSPFKTMTEAEQACEVMLGYLISDSPPSRPAAWTDGNQARTLAPRLPVAAQDYSVFSPSVGSSLRRPKLGAFV
jgi:hypothetical protein